MEFFNYNHLFLIAILGYFASQENNKQTRLTKGIGHLGDIYEFQQSHFIGHDITVH
jgi:hypothetical protein